MMVAIAPRTEIRGGTLLAIVASSVQAAFLPSAWARTSRIEPISSYVSGTPVERREQATMLSVQEIILAMRDGRTPVSAIAEMARVERKTVYAWLNGSDVRPERETRVNEIFRLLTQTGADLQSLWRVWNRPLSAGSTLRDLLSSETLDHAVILAACDELRPAIERHASREAVRRPARSGKDNPVLDEIPVADLG